MRLVVFNPRPFQKRQPPYPPSTTDAADSGKRTGRARRTHSVPGPGLSRYPRTSSSPNFPARQDRPRAPHTGEAQQLSAVAICAKRFHQLAALRALPGAVHAFQHDESPAPARHRAPSTARPGPAPPHFGRPPRAPIDWRQRRALGLAEMGRRRRRALGLVTISKR